MCIRDRGQGCHWQESSRDPALGSPRLLQREEMGERRVPRPQETPSAALPGRVCVLLARATLQIDPSHASSHNQELCHLNMSFCRNKGDKPFSAKLNIFDNTPKVRLA